MSTQMPFDPISIWKNIYEQTEKNWSQALHDLMEKEAFSEGMGETLNHYLQYQELVNKMTEAYLKEVNLPSRSEVADIASLIINLEEKVDNLDDDVDERLAEVSKTKEVRQLRRAVTNLDKKVSSILEAIELMNEDKVEKEEKSTKKKTKKK